MYEQNIPISAYNNQYKINVYFFLRKRIGKHFNLETLSYNQSESAFVFWNKNMPMFVYKIIHYPQKILMKIEWKIGIKIS